MQLRSRNPSVSGTSTFGVLIRCPILLVLSAFAIVYACSLSFVYVEGDDASSIAFHALGRNPALQPPYSPYQGMMDVVLSGLPKAEPILRVTAMSMTGAAGIGFVALMAILVFQWLGGLSPKRQILDTLVILVVCPEFYYLGLVYTPTLVAMCLLLASHLLARRSLRHSDLSAWHRLSAGVSGPLSLVFFGLGVACRWNCMGYGLVIVADLMIGRATARAEAAKLESRQITFGVLWGFLAITAAVVAVQLTGYSITEIWHAVRASRPSETRLPFSISSLGRLQTLLTPALFTLAAVGYISLLSRRITLALLVLVGIAPVVPFASAGVPKWILTAAPGLLLATVHGFNVVWFAPLRRSILFSLRVAVAAVLLAPWLVGIRVYSSDTAWGPGFAIKFPDGLPHSQSQPIVRDRTIASRGIAVSAVAPTFGAGFAIPTPEGPRALGGQAAVLLGGRWRALVTRLDQERRRAIQVAIARNVPLLQDEANALVVIYLVEMGFSTNDPKGQFTPSGIAARRFRNDRGQQVIVYALRRSSSLSEAKQLESLVLVSKTHVFVLSSGYSSQILNLLRIAPLAVRPLGPFSAVIDVSELHDAIESSMTATAKDDAR